MKRNRNRAGARRTEAGHSKRTASALKFWQMSFRRKSEPPPQKGKAARPGKGETALKNYRQPDFITARRARQQGRIEVDAILALHLVLAAVVGILWELTR